MNFETFKQKYTDNIDLYNVYITKSINHIIDVRLKDKNNNSIYHYLALSGNYEELKKQINNSLFLSKIFKNYNYIIEHTNNKQHTIFHFLALSGNYNGLKQAIIDFNIDINSDNCYNGNKLFHFLALSGNYNVLKQAIIDYDIDIYRYRNYTGQTLFHFLALSGNYDGLKQAIIDFNIDINNHINHSGYTIFDFLALSGNYNGLKQAIIDFNINLNINFSILQSLALSRNFDGLKQAILDFKNLNQDTLLILASYNNDIANYIFKNMIKNNNLGYIIFDSFINTHKLLIYYYEQKILNNHDIIKINKIDRKIDIHEDLMKYILGF